MKHKSKPKSAVIVENKNSLEDLIGYIDSNWSEFRKTLKEIVEINSSSSEPWKRIFLTVMVKWCSKTLRSLGGEVEECHSNYEFQNEELGLDCPPVLFASFGKDPSKKTVCVYNYLDISSPQGASLQMNINGKYITGPGVANQKGPLLQWIIVIQAHREVGLPLPVNIKFILDPFGLTEVSRLIEVLSDNKDTFLKNIDYYVTYSPCGVKNKIPSIVYGLRGICFFYIRVYQNEGCPVDRSSINNDLIYMLDNSVDSSGEIMVEDINVDVPEIEQAEIDWFNMMPVDMSRIKEELFINHLWSIDKVSFLSKIWRFPAISFHSYPDTASKSSEMFATFSVKTVPKQTPGDVRRLVFNHLARKWNERNSENLMQMGMNFWSWPWRADQFDVNYKFITAAVSEVYGENPPQVLEGSSLPFPAIIRFLVDKNVMILSTATFTDESFTTNERLSIQNFLNGIKVIAHYIHKIE